MKCLETLVDSKLTCNEITRVVPGWKSGEELRHLDIADIHLGSLRNDLGDAASLERGQQAFDEFLLAVDKYQPHIVFIVGDVYMHKTVHEAEEQCWTNFLAALLKKTLVVMQPGNHDFLERNLTTLDSLQTFYDNRLIENLIITSYDSQLITLCSEDDPAHNFVVLNCPCLTPLALNEVMKANVVLYHGNVRGAIMDNGFSIPSEEDKRVSLPFKLADLFILGDIHKRQWVSDNAYYTGSMYQTKFSEDAEKGYVKGIFKITEDGFCWESEHVTLETPYQLKTLLIQTDEDWPTNWEEHSQYYVRLVKNINLKEKPILPSFVIKEVFSGSIKSDVYNKEVDVSIQIDDMGLQSLDFLENQFEGASEFLDHLQDTSDFKLEPDEKILALAELEEIRAHIGK